MQVRSTLGYDAGPSSWPAMPVVLVVRHASGAGALRAPLQRTGFGRPAEVRAATPRSAFAGGLETLSTRMAMISF